MATSVRLHVRLTTLNRRAWITVGFFTAGLFLALVAQLIIYQSGEWYAGAIIYASALVLLIAAWTRDGSLVLPIRDPLRGDVPIPLTNPTRRYFLLPALLFALISFVESTGNRFALLNTTTWVISIILFFVAFWEGSLRDALRGARDSIGSFVRLDRAGQHTRRVTLALVLIMLAGIFFYFYQLDAVPAEMTSDHAEKILDTYDILHGKYSIFFERNTGREPLQFYMNALVVVLGIAPLDMLALKTVGALAGVLTIPGVFFLAREMFDDDVGLLAAFFFAVSIFPVGIARIGLRYPLSPLFVAWTLFFLLRGLREQRRNDFLLAGLMLGLGLNGYSPFRVVVLLVLVWLALWLVLRLNVELWKLPRYVANAAIMFGAALLVFVPLLRYISEHPENFFYRMATRLTSLEEPVKGDPIQIFFNNNWRALGMFNLRGDVVWVNSIPNVPSVDFVIGACFLIGVLYGAYRLIRYREYPFLLIFSAIFILLLPSTLALAFPEENPSVVRAGGVAPFVMIVAALPIAMWWRQFARLGSGFLGGVLVYGVLVLAAVINFNLYFYRYDDEFRRASWNSTEIADTLRQFAVEHNDWEHIYVVSYPH